MILSSVWLVFSSTISADSRVSSASTESSATHPQEVPSIPVAAAPTLVPPPREKSAAPSTVPDQLWVLYVHPIE